MGLIVSSHDGSCINVETRSTNTFVFKIFVFTISCCIQLYASSNYCFSVAQGEHQPVVLVEGSEIVSTALTLP